MEGVQDADIPIWDNNDIGRPGEGRQAGFESSSAGMMENLGLQGEPGTIELSGPDSGSVAMQLTDSSKSLGGNSSAAGSAIEGYLRGVCPRKLSGGRIQGVFEDGGGVAGQGGQSSQCNSQDRKPRLPVAAS